MIFSAVICTFSDGDESIEFRIEVLNAREAIAGEFDGGDGAVANLPAKLLNCGTHVILDRSKRFYRLWEECIASESN